MTSDFIKLYKDVILETHRFERCAQDALKRLESDEYARFRSKETAKAKRASMDLSRMLSKLRNPWKD